MHSSSVRLRHGVARRHLAIPIIHGSRGCEVLILEVVRDQTGHIVHGFVDLTRLSHDTMTVGGLTLPQDSGIAPVVTPSLSYPQ